MSHRRTIGFRLLYLSFHLVLVVLPPTTIAVSGIGVRVAASNLPGDSQTYGAAQIRILQGLKPDVVAIQEFNHAGSTRSFVDTTFGTNFSFFRESGYSIPNGIISRFPILAAGSWQDTVQSMPNRGFAWAQLDLPGPNDLFVVSVHFLTTSSTNRASQAENLKALIQSNFPANAWIVVAGDLNTDSRNEPAIFTLTNNFLSDRPVPTDAEANGNPNTNEPRSKPYDYVLTSVSLTPYLTNAAFASRSFSNGLVFDSRLYSPLSDVSPVQLADSAACQHMAVLKDFFLPSDETNTNQPFITQQPQSRMIPPGDNATFEVAATGESPLRYQWRFNESNLAGATASSHTVTNAQTTNAGNYTVVITNAFGSVTSEVAVLSIDSHPAGTPRLLAGWDVSTLSNFGPSPLMPTTNAPQLNISGLTRSVGVGTSGTAASRAWGGTGFDATTASAAINAGDYATFSVSAQSGFKISFTGISRFDYRRSSTGPSAGLLQYQIGNAAFADAATLAYPVNTSGGASVSTINLSGITSLQNVASGVAVTFRIVNFSASSAGGTWYLYDVANSTAPDFVVEGIVASNTPPNGPPPASPILTSPVLTSGILTLTLTGTTGSNYVIQAATNPATGNWIPLLTNAAPFTFNDSNALMFPQRFYRGAAPP